MVFLPIGESFIRRGTYLYDCQLEVQEPWNIAILDGGPPVHVVRKGSMAG